MKTLCVSTIFCILIALPAFSQSTLSPEDLDKIRLIVNDIVKKEITDVEGRLKDYVNIKLDAIENKIESVDKRVEYGVNITYGLIALIVVAVGIPQIISMWQGGRQRELERRIEELYRKIETLEQQRIVNP